MKIIISKGGAGSGHYGHSGRPGKVGGSVPDADFKPHEERFNRKNVGIGRHPKSVYTTNLSSRVEFVEGNPDYPVASWIVDAYRDKVRTWASFHDPVAMTTFSKLKIYNSDEDFHKDLGSVSPGGVGIIAGS